MRGLDQSGQAGLRAGNGRNFGLWLTFVLSFALGEEFRGEQHRSEGCDQQRGLPPPAEHRGIAHEREPREAKQKVYAEYLQRRLSEHDQGPDG